MAEIDPSKPQVTDPITVADLVRVLSVRGSLGVLDVADIILPTISVGQIRPLEVAIRTPVFGSTNVFSEGLKTAPGAATLMADTGQLPAGTYDVMIQGSADDLAGSAAALVVQHRNAANTATLATWFNQVISTARNAVIWDYTLGYTLAENERLRIVTNIAAGAGVVYSATIFAIIRQ